MSDTSKLFIGLIAAVIIGVCIVGIATKDDEKLGYGGGYNIMSNPTDYQSYGSAWASTTAGKIIDRNVDRSYLSISNNGTNTVYIWPATSTETYNTAAADKGIAIFASSTETFYPGKMLFYSEVVVITGVGEALLNWFEE